MILRTLAAALAAGLIATGAFAQEFKPAVVFDMGGKFDKSFNEGVWSGVQRFQEETGVEVMEFEVTNEAQREQAMQRMVQRGATVVLGVGFAQADAIDKVAGENPDTDFAIIDVNWLDRPNLRQYSFKEHEGSYLVGVAAAKASETGTVGFVGGMDIPLIRKFACGYKQGVLDTNPDATVLENMLAPGNVLTSMIKRVDVAAYDTLMDSMNDAFTPGVVTLGLAEEGVGWAVDEHNEPLLTDELKQAVETAREGIIAGDIEVHNYEDTGDCPV